MSSPLYYPSVAANGKNRKVSSSFLSFYFLCSWHTKEDNQLCSIWYEHYHDIFVCTYGECVLCDRRLYTNNGRPLVTTTQAQIGGQSTAPIFAGYANSCEQDGTT